jgi:hypothetical protein
LTISYPSACARSDAAGIALAVAEGGGGDVSDSTGEPGGEADDSDVETVADSDEGADAGIALAIIARVSRLLSPLPFPVSLVGGAKADGFGARIAGATRSGLFVSLSPSGAIA